MTAKKKARRRKNIDVKVLMPIVVIVILVAALIVIAFLMNAPQEPAGGHTQGTSITLTELGAGVADALGSTEHVIRTLSVGLGESGRIDSIVEVDMSGMAIPEDVVDLEESEFRKLKAHIVSTFYYTDPLSGDYNATVEAYLVNGTSYLGMLDLLVGEVVWMKASSGELNRTAIIESQMQQNIPLAGNKGEILGVEELNGEEAYKVSLELDEGAMEDLLLSSGIGWVPEGRLQMIEWISKRTMLPMKVYFETEADIDSDGVLDDVEFVMVNDYETPVRIVVPGYVLENSLTMDEIGECGDGVCSEYEESTEYCFLDCAYCGNGRCDILEGSLDCPEDCYCGNQQCDAGEGKEDCPSDCYCGNGECEWLDGEDSGDCPSDCYCGDYVCDGAEDEDSCPFDCLTCGDGYCSELDSEDSGNCPEDCYCGNFWCDSGENETTCPEDCTGF